MINLRKLAVLAVVLGFSLAGNAFAADVTASAPVADEAAASAQTQTVAADVKAPVDNVKKETKKHVKHVKKTKAEEAKKPAEKVEEEAK